MANTDTLSPTPGSVSRDAAAEAGRYDRSHDMLKSRMTDLVKGAGFVGNGNTALSDPVQVATKATQATLDLRAETQRGFHDKASVVKGMSPDFLNQFGNLKTALTAPSVNDTISQIVNAVGNPDLTRSFTAGNLGA